MGLPDSPRGFNARALRPSSCRVYGALLRARVGWPNGEAAACKAVYAGSNPVPTSLRNARMAAPSQLACPQLKRPGFTSLRVIGVLSDLEVSVELSSCF
jgi:hypothetical protein